ncbi:carbohydrate porin [Colwelliaceae bacterium BS250]
MKISKYIQYILVALMPITAFAQTPTDSETFAESPMCKQQTLTGDWSGSRTDLKESGIAIKAEYTGFYQGMEQGTGDKGYNFDNRFDLYADFDLGELGLWEGAKLHTHTEYVTGNTPMFHGGALWPQFSGTVVPLGYNDEIALTSLYLSKSYDSTHVMFGKINALDLLAGDQFFGGLGTERFMNIAFVAPPSGLVPPVMTGAIVSHRMGDYTFTGMVFDPNDQTSNNNFKGLFDELNVQLGITKRVKLFDRASTIGLNGTYSTATKKDLRDFLLPVDTTLPFDDIAGTKNGSYSISLQASHILVESDAIPGKGLGIYAKGTLSDGNPNIINSSLLAGFTAEGIINARPHDKIGLGYYYYNFSDHLQDALLPLAEYKNEDGVELYYNASITPWMNITADIQAINPATANNDDIVMLGLRIHIKL